MPPPSGEIIPTDLPPPPPPRLPTCERLYGAGVSFDVSPHRRIRVQEVQEPGKRESQFCPADSCSPAGQPGAGLLALAAAGAAAAATAGPTALAPQWPRSEAHPQTGPKYPAWLAKLLSCPASATPIPRPAWTRSVCCGAAWTERRRCSGSFTSPQW